MFAIFAKRFGNMRSKGLSLRNSKIRISLGTKMQGRTFISNSSHSTSSEEFNVSSINGAYSCVWAFDSEDPLRRALAVAVAKPGVGAVGVCGNGVGLVTRAQPAAEIVEEMRKGIDEAFSAARDKY